MGSLGPHPDGRTILLDWPLPGAGPACWDLCWYLALNRARLPEPKEAALGRFRAALASHGIAPGYLHKSSSRAYRARLAGVPACAGECRFVCGKPVGNAAAARTCGISVGARTC